MNTNLIAQKYNELSIQDKSKVLHKIFQIIPSTKSLTIQYILML